MREHTGFQTKPRPDEQDLGKSWKSGSLSQSKMEAGEEIFFSDDEDESSEGEGEGDQLITNVIEVSQSLQSEAIDEKEANNHNNVSDEKHEEEREDKVFSIEYFPEKGDNSLSSCFSDGVRCANCVSKLVYTPGCGRKTYKSKTCGCPKCDPSSLPGLRCDRCGVVSYCSVSCQQEHWDKNHKKMCKILSGVSPISQRRRRNNDLSEEDDSVDWVYCNKMMERSRDNIRQIFWTKFQYHTETSRCNCKTVNKGTATIYDEERSSNLQFPFKIGEVKNEFLGWIDEYLFHLSRLLIIAVSVNLAIIMKDKDLSLSYGSILNYLHYLRATYYYFLTIERSRPATDILFALKVAHTSPIERHNSIFGGNPFSSLEKLWNVQPKKARYIPFIHYYLAPIIVNKNAYWEVFLTTMSDFFKRLRKCKYLVLNFDNIPKKKEENFYNTRIFCEMALKKLREKVKIVYPSCSKEHPLFPKHLKTLPENTKCCMCSSSIGGMKAQQQIQHRFHPWFALTTYKPKDIPFRYERFKTWTFPMIHDQDFVNKPIVSCGDLQSYCSNQGIKIAEFYEFKEASTFVYFLQHSRLCQGCQRYSVNTHKCSKCLSVR